MFNVGRWNPTGLPLDNIGSHIMGYSLYVHRSDGRDAHLSPVALPQALALFHEIPWRDDVAHWLAQPSESREDNRPLFRLSDDAGASLNITAYSDDLLAFLYEYPVFALIETQGVEGVGTDQYPRAEIRALLSAFFQDDRGAILRFIEQYPTKEEET